MIALDKTMPAEETQLASFSEMAFEEDAPLSEPVSVEWNCYPDERSLIEDLRNGDEEAFTLLVNRYQNSLLRIARLYVSSRAVAEEVVQETWIGVLQGIHRFEGRSSIKTWVFSILTNRSRSRGVREARQIPFSVLCSQECAPGEPPLDPSRFHAHDAQWPEHWAQPPQSWGESPEKRLLMKETQAHLREAIAALPPAQREVIALRDIEQWTSHEVCNALGISETNQRVLLHRARSRVRRSLESYFQK